MSKETPAGPLVIALRVDDPVLTERVARALAEVPGVRLAGAGEAADVAALLRTLGPDSVGRNVAIGLRRGGAPLQLTLTVGERPQA